MELSIELFEEFLWGRYDVARVIKIVRPLALVFAPPESSLYGEAQSFDTRRDTSRAALVMLNRAICQSQKLGGLSLSDSKSPTPFSELFCIHF